MNKGFTMAEMAITLVLGSVLAVIGVANYTQYKFRARAHAQKTIFHDMLTSLEARKEAEAGPGSDRIVRRFFNTKIWDVTNTTTDELLPGFKTSVAPYFYPYARSMDCKNMPSVPKCYNLWAQLSNCKEGTYLRMIQYGNGSVVTEEVYYEPYDILC